jgi:hypothetical protein
VLIALGAAMPLGVLTGVGVLSLAVASLRIAGSIPVIKVLLTAEAGADELVPEPTR